ncbi:hypothetical protein AAWM_07297 [Aspergillus awamori]|uniref:Uncharacterized protein n=1 Tax=Aspergillus awamori TaxID=105351 RepID=A0A401KYX4_ASPAW|nr:hypothetical protein AAWM_07297 [Aspergillus awamori]
MNKPGKGTLYLNSYGYKSCALIVWEHDQAERTVGSLTNIRGGPHQKALETNADGEYAHKGKIKTILNVAWQPKRKIRSIDDLLNTAEELNPRNKERYAKYRAVSSTNRGGEASHPASNLEGAGDQNGLNQVDHAQGAEAQGGRTSPSKQGRSSQVSPNPSSQASGSQSQASRSTGNQNHISPSQGSSEPEEPKQRQQDRIMSIFHAERLRENSLDANTDVDAIGDELFGRFATAAHTYADENASKADHQLLNNMNILDWQSD